MKNKIIQVKGLNIVTFEKDTLEFISLTDIAKFRNSSETDDVIKNWLRNKGSIEFLGLWEKINNPNFKPAEFEGFKNEAGNNSFVLSVSKWTSQTNAIGIYTKQGRGGGTFAHKDIAFEFASWLSPEFKLYLIKEFQRLKTEENKRLVLDWDIRRTLTKINYRIHTSAIQKYIIPTQVSDRETSIIYANEADVLNVALFGITAKEWRDKNVGKEGNIRDYSTVEQLVVLTNLESMNAEFIRQGVAQGERLKKLNAIAINQMLSLLGNPSVKKLKP